MGTEKMRELIIGDMRAKIPIVQGGMGVGVSMAGLASAVANEGGIGVLSAAGIGMSEPDFASNFRGANIRGLKKEIQKARSLTKGLLGVNLMMALGDVDELTAVAIEERIDIIFLGAGVPVRNPKILMERIEGTKYPKVIPIVSSARVAEFVFKTWGEKYGHIPDGVVLEGPMAGGHLGFSEEQINDPEFALEKLLPNVIKVMKQFEQQFNKNIPIIAAGGIYNGEDIYKFMQIGASGVQMATRFVATDECDASSEFKQAYLDCKKEDLIIIKSPVGLPGRAIRNKFLDDVTNGKNHPIKCPWKCLKTCDFRNSPYCIALALTKAKIGELNEGFCFAGANAYRVDRIVSVKELIDTLGKEYVEATNK